MRLVASAVRRPRRRLHGSPSRFRAVLGITGEIAVTTGILLLLYWLWLFWWTSMLARGAADDLVTRYVHDLPPASAQHPPLRTDPPPILDEPGTGELIGILRVPSWNGLTTNAMPILQGTGRAILNQGAAGHYENTQMPGDIGNSAYAGHRRGYGNSFFYVDRLQSGARIVIETPETWYVYTVTGAEIVDPSEYQVTSPVPHHPERKPGKRLLTLTTCHSLTAGAYGNDHRWITYAEFAGWLPRAEGTPRGIDAA